MHTLSLLGFAAMLATACGRTGLDAGDLAGPPESDDAAPEATAPVIDAPSAPDPCANAPPIPCAGGGYQYCVAGQYSDCPKRCEACIPGGQRVCSLAYCQYWGVQTCTADGRSFGYCVEQAPPAECQTIADQHHDSPELEQCCIDSGHCCRDEFDLNHNGDTNDQVGRCDGVSC